MVRTIYIVHPSSDERRALAGMVATEADEVRTFECPEEFLEAVAPNAIGCLIVPSDVPGVAMSALIDAIHNRGLALPVVALGRGSDVAEAVRAVRVGAADYLEPPVSGRRLRLAVRRTLAPRQP